MSPEDLPHVQSLIDDPLLRIRTLYQVKSARDGNMVPFIPTPEQEIILNAIHRDGLKKIIILKARQLGMSTVINVIMADLQIWNGGWQGTIVDEDHKAAALKLKYKVKAAFESMPAEIRSLFLIVSSNESEFAVRFKGTAADQVSTTFAGKNARGGTNQFLHISEWGPIQHQDPPRSEEIMTGAIPSAKEGIVAIETTWKGGKGGHLWSLTERAITTLPEHVTAEDYTLFFFPWHADPQYRTTGDFSQIPESIHAYFDDKEAYLTSTGKPHTFTPEQRLWYYKVALPKGNQRYAEYPTTLEECFLAPVPGAIYAQLIDQARAEGRIADFPWSREHPVHTFWDLGSPENTRVAYVQFVGREIHVIDYDSGLDLTPAQRVAHLRAKGYTYHTHHLPHDAAARERGGLNFEDQLKQAGLAPLTIIPQTNNLWTGINKMTELLPRIWFHKSRCEKLIAGLDAYHTREDRTNPGHQTSTPVHDWASHDADAFRYIGEAMAAGLVKNGPQPPPPRVISPIEGLGDVTPHVVRRRREGKVVTAM
ncbi:MAG: hypothetical protein EOP88_10360 [Verrucomicrobiaceae bacterium]|nr:MAG: hypothetical protein EOP88_10360 [Verrucomicrobiaceae bacterium]